MTLTTQVTVTEQKICDLFITAVEGGCVYWCECMDFRNDGEPVTYQKKESFIGAWTVTVEPFGDEKVTITPETLQKALKMRPKEAALLATDDPAFDAETADILVQCAAFGEIVYG